VGLPASVRRASRLEVSVTARSGLRHRHAPVAVKHEGRCRDRGPPRIARVTARGTARRASCGTARAELSPEATSSRGRANDRLDRRDRRANLESLPTAQEVLVLRRKRPRPDPPIRLAVRRLRPSDTNVMSRDIVDASRDTQLTSAAARSPERPGHVLIERNRVAVETIRRSRRGTRQG
jgi:hypothetical protein